MKELRCVILVTVVGLVTASPHGYGVKGGASARADSAASAGAFGGVGDIPVAIPLGAGYSGSFSKSSSSSSSSASSSSSSSSFTFNGAGAGGYSGLGANGATGCATGSCHNSGSAGLSGGQAVSGATSLAQGHNSADAAISDVTNGGGKPECNGASCSNGDSYTASSTPKCTTGQCGSVGANEAPNDHGSNDIQVPYSSKSVDHSKEQTASSDKTTSYDGSASGCATGRCGQSTHGYIHDHTIPYETTKAPGPPYPGYQAPASQYHNQGLNHDKTSSIYDNTAPGCSGGSCGQPAPVVGTKPSYIHDHTVYYETTKAPVTPHTGFGSNSDYKGPASGSTGPGCSGGSTGNCKPTMSPNNNPNVYDTLQITSNTGYPTPSSHLETPKLDAKCESDNCYLSYSSSLPSSYNVPIHGSYDYNNPKKPCDGTNCDYPPKGSNAGNTLSSNYLNPQFSPSTGKTETTSNTYPNYDNCQGSNCGTGALGKPSNYNYKPNEGSTASKNKVPYTGGFGGPTGMLKPNDNGYHAPGINQPSIVVHALPNLPATAETPLSDCKSNPNCNEYSPTSGAVPSASSPGSPSKGNAPVYSGGFGGPTGALNPDTSHGHSSSTNYGHSSSGTSQVASSYPVGCTTANCIQSGNDQTNTDIIPVSSITHSEQSTGLSSPSGPGFTNPQSTGSYVSGCKTANCQTTTSNNNVQSGSTFGVSNQWYQDTTAQYKPDGPSSCKTASCGNLQQYPSAVVEPGIGSHPGPLVHPKPIYGANTVTKKPPPYTGGFGAPLGLIEPNKPEVHTNPSGCKTGNCQTATSNNNVQSGSSFGVTNQGYQDTAAQYKPDGPSGCTTANCGNLQQYPSAVAAPGIGSHPGPLVHPKPILGANTVTEKPPPYTGGFGAPLGLIEPNKPDGHANPSGCKTGNCQTPTSNYNVQSGSSFGVTNQGYQDTAAQYKPDGHANPSGCKTGNCQTPASNSNFQSGSAFGVSNQWYQDTAAQYKPNGPSGCKTANCGNLQQYPSAVAAPGIGSHPGPLVHPNPIHTVTAKPPPYTGGFGAPTGLIEPNKDGSLDSSSNSYHKPSTTGPSQPIGCSSGKCDNKPSHANSPSSISSSSGAHTGASASASAAVYTGGFGGPPGLLKPYDDGKLNSPPAFSGSTYNSKGNVHLHHDTPIGANAEQKVGVSSHEGYLSPTGSYTGGLASSSSYSGAAASAGSNLGLTSQGYTKDASPCGGGCGGTAGVGSSGSGYGGAGAAGSLSAARAFGASGSYASSSASAHASAGAYTKGGYGRR